MIGVVKADEIARLRHVLRADFHRGFDRWTAADSEGHAVEIARREARELVDAGLKVASLNVGGLHYSAGRIQLGRVIYLSDEDREDLRELVQRGIVLEGRAVPSDRRLDLASLIAA